MNEPSKYYDSIYTCPVLTWDRVNKTGDFDLLKIAGRSNNDLAKAAYEQIQNEYIEEFGVPETYKLYVEKARLAVRQYAEAVKKSPIDSWKMTLGNIYMQGS